MNLYEWGRTEFLQISHLVKYVPIAVRSGWLLWPNWTFWALYKKQYPVHLSEGQISNSSWSSAQPLPATQYFKQRAQEGPHNNLINWVQYHRYYMTVKKYLLYLIHHGSFGQIYLIVTMKIIYLKVAWTAFAFYFVLFSEVHL